MTTTKTTSDIDTYLRLKYGYPLTKDSYEQMPDELPGMIYRRLHIIKESNNNSVSYRLSQNTEYIRHGITVSFHLSSNRRNNNIYASKKAWEVIKEYYEGKQ